MMKRKSHKNFLTTWESENERVRWMYKKRHHYRNSISSTLCFHCSTKRFLFLFLIMQFPPNIKKHHKQQFFITLAAFLTFFGIQKSLKCVKWTNNKVSNDREVKKRRGKCEENCARERKYCFMTLGFKFPLKSFFPSFLTSRTVTFKQFECSSFSWLNFSSSFHALFENDWGQNLRVERENSFFPTTIIKRSK